MGDRATLAFYNEWERFTADHATGYLLLVCHDEEPLTLLRQPLGEGRSRAAGRRSPQHWSRPRIDPDPTPATAHMSTVRHGSPAIRVPARSRISGQDRPSIHPRWVYVHPPAGDVRVARALPRGPRRLPGSDGAAWGCRPHGVRAPVHILCGWGPVRRVGLDRSSAHERAEGGGWIPGVRPSPRSRGLRMTMLRAVRGGLILATARGSGYCRWLKCGSPQH